MPSLAELGNRERDALIMPLPEGAGPSTVAIFRQPSI
jgi:hypothetical protein